MKKYLNLFDFKQKVNYRTEILSGLTVALALVPEAIAFALIPDFSPLTGLYAAFVLCLVTAILGGRPGMISGATGAVAAIFIGMTLELKATFPDITTQGILKYVFAVVIVAGVIQILAGVFRLGKFIRLVPQPVIFGFVNGLANIIFMAQFKTFYVRGTDNTLLDYDWSSLIDHVDYLGTSKTDQSNTLFFGGYFSSISIGFRIGY